MFRSLKILISLTLLGTAIAAKELKDNELTSLYYADLGPAVIDVSAYPKTEQQNYTVFSKVCSQCHTLARAVNSPTTDADLWNYYVMTRMKKFSKFEPGTSYAADDAQKIVEFLIYDSKVRKIDRRKEFEALTRDLENRLAETIQERTHRLEEKLHKTSLSH